MNIRDKIFERDLICYRAMGVLRVIARMGDTPEYAKTVADIVTRFDIICDELSDDPMLTQTADEAQEMDRDRGDKTMRALYRFKQLGGATADCDLLALEMKRQDDWEQFQYEMAEYERDYF